MTPIDRFERQLPDELSHLAAERTPDYLDDLFAQTARTRQRPAWTFPERWLPMTITLRRPLLAPPMRLLAVGLALLLALLGAMALAPILSSPRPLPAAVVLPSNGITIFDRDGDIYAVDTLEGEPRVLIGDPAHDEGLDWAPDGSRFSFLRTDGATQKLMTALPDGTDERTLAEGIFDLSTYWWRPDSSSVVVVSKWGDAARMPRTARLAAADGTGIVALDLGAAGTDWAYWYPDGTALLVRTPGPQGAELRRYDVASRTLGEPILRSDPEGPLYAATRGSSDLQGAVVGPDGSIFYTQPVPLEGEHEMVFGGDGTRDFLADPDGSNVRMVEYSPAADYEDGTWFSPDGTRLSLISRTGEYHQVVFMDANGTDPVIATEPLHDPRGGLTNFWVPDGSGMLIVRDEFDEVSFVDAATGGITVLPWTTTGYPVTQPRWN